jgi:hypothetical protein
VPQHGVGLARQQTDGKRQVGVADARGVDLDEHLIGLHLVEVDLAELELAVELRYDEGGGGAGHVDVGGVDAMFALCVVVGVSDVGASWCELVSTINLGCSVYFESSMGSWWPRISSR